MKETPDRADTLAAATNEDDYQARLITLVRENSAVDLSRIELPHAPGLRGIISRWFRKLLWRLLRHQHEQVTLQHNAVHTLHAAALEFEHDRMRKKIDQLEQRLAQGKEQPASPVRPDTP